jgi:hypothetical protein
MPSDIETRTRAKFADGRPAVAPAKTEAPRFESNRVTPDFFFGLQPVTAETRGLKQFASVVRLCDGNQGGAEAPRMYVMRSEECQVDAASFYLSTREAEILREERIQYREMGVGSLSHLDNAMLDKVLAHIESLPKPLFVHCATGYASAMFVLLAVAKRYGQGVDQLIKMGERFGHDFQQDGRLLDTLRGYMGKSDFRTHKVTFSK